MSKYKTGYLKAFARAILVLILTVLASILAGILVADLLDYLSRNTNSFLWPSLFQFLSNYRVLVVTCICILAVVIFSNWIFAPVFNSFASLVSDNLQVSEEEGLKPPKLPKAFKEVEATLKDINKELRLWKYAVREAEQRKDDLVVSLAHDIRTPLTSILGYMELIHDNPELPEETRQKYAGIALRKANRMLSLVEELFEVTRFKIGRIELELTNISAEMLILQLTEELMPLLRRKNIEISVDNQGVFDIFVDPDKMARALDNILVNAANYTPEGEKIMVTLDKYADRSRIRIANTGMDIPQEKLDRFFEKFYRADEARQSGTGGSGLGLAIAKNIIEAHGGSITVSNANKITTFTIIC